MRLSDITSTGTGPMSEKKLSRPAPAFNWLLRLPIVLALSVAVLAPDRCAAQDASVCLTCHGEKDLSKTDESGAEVSLYVNTAQCDSSSHAGLSCIDCHASLGGVDESGHDTPVPEVDCSVCHGKEQTVFRGSIHGQLVAVGDKDAPRCRSCHGKHDIRPAADPASRVNKFNLMYTCAECHQNRELTEKHGIGQPDAVPQFYESVHAKGLLKDGLIVAPSCSDCHGSHEIQTVDNPESSIYKRNVYGTCGKCHTRVEAVYKGSVHGQLVENGDKRGPVCTDCHESHRIISPDEHAFKKYSEEKCGGCHREKLERYQETFHGKAMALGSTSVAACFDCHGHHDILPQSDPASHINPANRLETCRKCHPGAGPKFASFITHADYFDRQGYPVLFYTFLAMTALLIGVFAFFGLHTLLWVLRSMALFFRDSRAFRESKIKAKKGDLVFRRFSPLERTLHVLLIVSFTALVFTGVPLKFFHAGWARAIMDALGGVSNAGYMHRSAALILVLVFLVHVVRLLIDFVPRLLTFRNPDTGRFSPRAFLRYMFRPDSMMPGWKDVADFWNHQKWFFGKGAKPKFERWTYWEKFDYFAVFWGVAIIGFSGLIMWFPLFFTRFLPGWVINVAQIIHSDEALLAAGFIFTFHFFNVHFRIEKFPMDTVIFSGKLSRAELEEERGAWLERLEAEKKLDGIKAGDEWSSWRPIAKTFGFIAFGLGIVLAVAIFTAMAMRLLAP